MNGNIDQEKLSKVTNKLYSIALTKVFSGLEPKIFINEFKHIISNFKIKKSEWWSYHNSISQWEIEQYLTKF